MWPHQVLQAKRSSNNHECYQRCMDTPNCSFWVWCSQVGTSCLGLHTLLRASTAGTPLTRRHWSATVLQQVPGLHISAAVQEPSERHALSWADTASCMQLGGCDEGGVFDGQYPYQSCTLMQLLAKSDPYKWSRGPEASTFSSGWVTGATPKPALQVPGSVRPACLHWLRWPAVTRVHSIQQCSHRTRWVCATGCSGLSHSSACPLGACQAGHSSCAGAAGAAAPHARPCQV